MKRFFFIISCFFSTAFVFAQVSTSSVQFRRNLVDLNPGYLGIEQGLTISTVWQNRTQNVLLPSQYKVFQLNLPIRFYSMGLGVSVAQDKIGNNEESHLKVGYSYKIRALKGILSFGTFAGLTQYQLDFSNQTVRTKTDPTFTETGTKIAPLLSTGLFYRHKRFSLGVSSDDLLINDLSLNTSSTSRNSRNLIIYSEYRHEIKPKLSLLPGVLLDFQSQTPLSLALSTLIEIDNKYWVNLGYRLKSELFVSTGLDFEKLIDGFSQPIKIGFAYSLPTNSFIQNRNAVELFISFNYTKRPNPEKIRNQKRIVSPIIFY